LTTRKQVDRSKPIPGTLVFDLHHSHRGFRLNRLCDSLNAPENRAAFKMDEEGYLARFGLTEQEKALIRRRDWEGLIEAGANIYYLLKLGVVTGQGLYRMGAQMRHESYEEFLATRNVKGAV
jgi:protocatechuate 4,5-dioxygenase, alpha chain